MEYVISGMNGEKLSLATLKGKVVVFDFWATWCGPCRAQQPLYEEVKARFKDDKNVVFLNVSTDENREIVKPFLDSNKWKKTVYFEDGLSALLRVTSIPTTMIVEPPRRDCFAHERLRARAVRRDADRADSRGARGELMPTPFRA